MRPQSCKAKGRALQQTVAKDLMQTFPQLSANDVRSTSMGCGGEDVVLSPAAEAVFPFSIECKNAERLNVWAALQQAEANTSRCRTPIVIIKKNKQKPHAVVPWSVFLELAQRRGEQAIKPQPESSDSQVASPNHAHPREGTKRTHVVAMASPAMSACEPPPADCLAACIGEIESAAKRARSYLNDS